MLSNNNSDDSDNDILDNLPGTSEISMEDVYKSEAEGQAICVKLVAKELNDKIKELETRIIIKDVLIEQLKRENEKILSKIPKKQLGVEITPNRAPFCGDNFHLDFHPRIPIGFPTEDTARDFINEHGFIEIK